MTAPLFAAPQSDKVQCSAVISDDGLYRYRLDRWWGPESEGAGSTRLPFIMLNPSTADADVDDPTIRRCMGFARREGFHGITVVNLGAGRATNPDDWAAMDDPEGPENLAYLHDVAETAGHVVAAWGAHPHAVNLGTFVLRMLRHAAIPVLCLGTTKAGAPRHPLYVKGDQPLTAYRSAA